LKFKFEFVKTRNKYSYAELIVPIGSSICGMQLQGTRPQTVELNKEELATLLKSQEYAMTVLTALAFNE
jgi:hypothetical protein